LLSRRNPLNFVKKLLPLNYGTHLPGESTNIWRESVTDNHKITEEFKDVPLELSNALYLKTIERRLAYCRAT
jgi:hypothetical protein